MNTEWQVGLDIGGTFTDVVAVNPADGLVRNAKVRTLAGDPVASAEAALEAIGLSLPMVAELVHGTTMATNAIVEGKLSRVALVSTEGFRDTLAIGRQNRRDLYRLDVAPKLPPLVEEALRFEVPERVASDGSVLRPLNGPAADRVIQELSTCGPEAVAVALLHAYANPVHEQALGAALARIVPHIALSHQINPEAREYERTSATVLNAALMPQTTGYLDRLLAKAGNRTRVHLFHSAGGMASPEAAKRHPLALALSGPAAGVVGAGRIAAELDLAKLISFDMGGTTTDVCLVLEGAAQISGERRIAGRPIRQSMVAVETIGAGGGSLARVEGSAVRVGPESAGADPGPACYGAGGTQPTVTDANFLLGYLNPERRLGGTVRLDPACARAAISPLAERFETSLEEAAFGIHRIANANMIRALRRVTVERGVDARQCTLLAFGGAGPMHAVELARDFGISNVVVPHFSSMFSALGCLTAELSYSQQQTVRMASGAWDAERLAGLRDELLERLSALLLTAGYDRAELRIEDVAAIRYAGQSYAVDVPYAAPADPARLDSDFKMHHRSLYGFATDEPWEFESLRLKVSAPPRNGFGDLSGSSPTRLADPISVTPCWFRTDGAVPTPRFAREALSLSQEIAGPAVIEDAWSTIVVNPGAIARCATSGHILIEVGAE